MHRSCHREIGHGRSVDSISLLTVYQESTVTKQFDSGRVADIGVNQTMVAQFSLARFSCARTDSQAWCVFQPADARGYFLVSQARLVGN